MKESHKFATRLGFILTAAAAAIGLGNIWRFPYLTAEYGGGIFVFFYLIFVVTFGFALMVTETAIGRKTGKSSAEAFASLCDRHKTLGKITGILSFVVALMIMSYYTVITGWVLKYAASYLFGYGDQLAADGGSFFSTYVSTGFEPIFWTFIVFAAAAVVLMLGIQKGLEKVCVVLVPLLFLCMAGLAAYVLTQPGGIDGLAYCFIPDFSKFSPGTLLAALGQVFFSLSIGYGIYITYGMYLSKKENLKSSVHSVEIFDTAAALLAMILVIPIVFAFSGGSPEALGSGGALLFEQIPQALHGFPYGGNLIGFIFFFVVFLAALASVFAILEIPIAALESKFSMNRRKAIALICGVTALASVAVNFGYSIWKDVTILGNTILDALDQCASNVLIPISAILICIIVGWIVGTKSITDEIESNGQVFHGKKLFNVMIKFIVPAFVLLIMISHFIHLVS